MADELIEAAREHLDRLIAMRDDDGETWDLSGNDKTAISWVFAALAEKDARISRLKAERQGWLDKLEQGATIARLTAESAQWRESSGQNYVRAQEAEDLAEKAERERDRLRGLIIIIEDIAKGMNHLAEVRSDDWDVKGYALALRGAIQSEDSDG